MEETAEQRHMRLFYDGLTWDELLEKYSQPEECACTPNSTVKIGCLSLIMMKVSSENFCKNNCDYYIDAHKT